MSQNQPNLMSLDAALEDLFPSTRIPVGVERNALPQLYLSVLELCGSKLEKDLQIIRSQQNKFALPNRLPTEVLEKIFLALAKTVSLGWAEESSLSWFRVAQVCQRWRDVAVNCAPLWRTIVLSKPEFMDLMFTRSKGMPLEFSFNTEELKYIRRPSKFYQRLGSMQKMFRDLSRFRSLSLRFQKGRPTTSLQDLLGRASGSAPQLVELKLTSNCKARQTIPSSFLGGGAGAPALRLLELERVSISWERIPLPATLTSLTLRKGKDRPSATQFYTALSNLKALRTLTLVKWLPRHADATVTPFQSSPVVMDSLKTIEVEDLAEELTQFFNAVIMPRMTFTKVVIGDTDYEGPDVDRCFAAVRRAVNEAVKDFGEVSGIAISNFDVEEVQMDPGCHPMVQLSYNRLPQRRWFYLTQGISLEFKYVPESLPEIFAYVNKNFDFTTAKTLDVSVCGDVPPDLILEIFSPLQRLEDLSIASTPVYALFQAMIADPALQAREKTEPDDSPSPKPFFPTLESLTLTHVDFEEEETGVGEVRQAMVEALTVRPDAHAIRQVKLEECMSFYEEDYDAVSTLLYPRTKVYFDNGEDMSSDSGSDEESGEDIFDYESS